jgi:CO dehydrogenase/acetyl-CoA synthase gamma subunit (corrinoid Fe-S protein)
MTKKSNVAVTLSREQVKKLNEIVNHFKEVEYFDVVVDPSSGIGTGMSVTFDLFTANDTKVDITEYDKW